jgi:2-polyprenyl-6-hydroxyphenyl methylase/3-demethylubiquinone-9 3-methyltransferase
MSQTADRLTDQRYWEDNWTARGRTRWADLAWMRARYAWVVWDAILRRRLRPRPGASLLEVGCGTGRWLIYFHKAFGYAVTGCDYSDASCQLAGANLARAGVGGAIHKADLFALTGRYDVVYSAGLIEHFTDTRAVLAKFVSLLNPGGTLVSIVPNLAGVSGAYHRLLKPETFSTHRVIRRRDLQRWYEELGLQNVEHGAVGSIVPSRFPRTALRSRHPYLYRLAWPLALQPSTWLTNRVCTWGWQRLGVRVESERFSPYLYAIGDRAAGG